MHDKAYKTFCTNTIIINGTNRMFITKSVGDYSRFGKQYLKKSILRF